MVPSDYAEQLEAHLVKISAHVVQPGGGFVRRVVAATEDADYAADLGDKCVSIGNSVVSRYCFTSECFRRPWQR